MAENTNTTSPNQQFNSDESTLNNTNTQQEENSMQNIYQVNDDNINQYQQLSNTQDLNQNDLELNTTQDYQNFFNKIVQEKEKYLLNPAFKNLYNEASTALGLNFNAKKFITLLDNYVDTIVKMHDKSKAINDSNDKITDKMQFQLGQSKNINKPLRMQDIKPEELEKYIAQYV